MLTKLLRAGPMQRRMATRLEERPIMAGRSFASAAFVGRPPSQAAA